MAGAGEIFGSASETFAILDNADIVFPYVLDDDGKEVQLSVLVMQPSQRILFQKVFMTIW
ncbi:oligoendopeptidase F [Streptococcus pneumoniae]|nr:oligoendopeptidase F [Streptococcus pneumoniae]